MTRSPLTRTLPAHPDLDHLRRQAKTLLKDFLRGDAHAVAEVTRHYRGADVATFALHDAQLVLARSYGYDSWPKLKAYVDGVTVTRLIDAVRAGDKRAAAAVLDVRPELVDVVQAWNNEQTALHYAVLGRMPRMVRLLMQRGANPRAGISPLNDATTPLVMAQDRGYDDIVQILHEEERRRERQSSSMAAASPDTPPAVSPPSPADAAVARGDEAALRALHAEGRLAAPHDELGGVLRTAVEVNRPDMLTLLLDLGLDPDARARVEGVDETAWTWGMPLYLCVRTGRHAMAEILLERGADPNAQVYASGTPLAEAYGQRDDRMIALLDRYGGRSNPSMAGFYRRKDLALRLLAEHGDTPLPHDGFGSGTVAEQLIGAAARGGDPEILRMAMARVDWPIGDARWFGALAGPLEFWNHWIGPWCHPEWDRSTYLTCFTMILERCGPADRQGRFGTTLLHFIVRMGTHVTADERVAFAAAALDAGARLNRRDELLKSTPLGWACRWGCEELVRLFLARGADPVEADAEPWATPRAWAAKKGHASIAALLRSPSRT